jgi:hypothetical protein
MNEPRAPRGVYIVEEGVGGTGPRGTPKPTAPPWTPVALGETLGAWLAGPWPAWPACLWA